VKIIFTSLLLSYLSAYVISVVFYHFLGIAGLLPALVCAIVVSSRSRKIVEWAYGYTLEQELKNETGNK